MNDFEFSKNGLTYRLYCGDYLTVLPSEKWNLIWTSPPYNVGPKRGKRGSVKFGGITGYPDHVPEEQYQAEQGVFFGWAICHVLDDGFVVYNHKPRHRRGRLIYPNEWFPSPSILQPCDHVTWDRGSTMNLEPSFLRPVSEDLYVFCKPGKKPFFRNEGYGSVWRIDKAPKGFHCAPFPLELARRVVRLWCPPKGVVCDPYSGSGTSMLAAYLEGRSFLGSELMPGYFQQSVERFLAAVNGGAA